MSWLQNTVRGTQCKTPVSVALEMEIQAGTVTSRVLFYYYLISKKISIKEALLSFGKNFGAMEIHKSQDSLSTN